MCGISGVIDVRRSRPPADHVQLAQQLNASLDAIAHRGPDSRGHWISADARVALAHARLAINDLSPDGAQPLVDASGQIHAVVNGELYDHERLRDELAAGRDGYAFRGHSDSEIVVALYLRDGLAFLESLRGEFALCLYDERTKLFVAARDRYGIKPLFYTRVDGRVLFAAEAKAFMPLGWQPEWDVLSLMELGWGHDTRTIFRGVEKLRPGHYLTINASGHMQTASYWDISYADKHIVDPRSEDEIVTAVRAGLLEAVRLRLRADVPIGVYLSGGIDSSAIAGMVTHLVSERGERLGSANPRDRVRCFSIAFDESSGFDESDVANRTAAHLNVQHDKKHMSEAALAARFEDATWHAEHHNPDLNFVGKFALSEVPRAAGVKVVLTGEGADEIFGGYPLFLPDFLRERDSTWPAASQALADDKRVELCAKVDQEIGDHYTSIGADGTNRNPSIASRYLGGTSVAASMAAFAPRLFTKWAHAAYPNADPQSTIAQNVPAATATLMRSKWHPLHAAQYAWTKGNLVNQFLSCLGDRTEMAHGVEARTPFLDHHLTSLVDHAPPSLKIKYEGDGRFIQKHLLREAVRPFVTDEVYTRKKHPYSAPTTWPRDGPLHTLIKSLVTQESVATLGFVDWDAVAGVVDAAFGETGDPAAMRTAFVVAQWVVLSRRFGIKTATARDV